jgi:2-C-methyl-D-erythritol 4-phosphate cytidylyltransferase
LEAALTIDEYDVPDRSPALGSVVEEDRGTLPFALIHGEALVACAAWALAEAGVTTVDQRTEWSGIVDSGEPFVLHDVLCPMTPASFITTCVATAVGRQTVVVGVRPVADPRPQGGDGSAVDRADLVSVASPVVLPPGVVAALAVLPTLDFAGLVAALRARFPVTYVEAPPEAARVGSVDDIRALEALTLPTP